ncbi:hypothetical protein P4S73_11935 [Paraglaciecola sp. Hal342]
MSVITKLDTPAMNNSQIKSVNVELFNVPLDEVLNDAKHGDHTHFELILCTITCANGTQGVGYTYTGGKGGRAIFLCSMMN